MGLKFGNWIYGSVPKNKLSDFNVKNAFPRFPQPTLTLQDKNNPHL